MGIKLARKLTAIAHAVHAWSLVHHDRVASRHIQALANKRAAVAAQRKRAVEQHKETLAYAAAQYHQKLRDAAEYYNETVESANDSYDAKATVYGQELLELTNEIAAAKADLIHFHNS